MSRPRAVVNFPCDSGGKRAICDCESTSRVKNNDCSQSKFRRNIVYVSSISRDFSFHFLHVLPNLVASRVKKGVTSLRDSHAHVLANSKFFPYEYKQALFCMIAGAILCILR